MKYTHFDISNFKGIEHVRLDLTKAPRSRVHTLIGLNESGKTTVLEAIDRLSYRESLDALSPPGYERSDVHQLIPIAKRANFNETIIVEAGIALDHEDQTYIKKTLQEQHNIKLTTSIQPFTITQSYEFNSSKVLAGQPTSTWRIGVKGIAPDKKHAAELATGENWKHILAIMKPLIPRIVYFPNFLFDFPDRIYLENAPADEATHAFYRTVLQDVLDKIGDKTTLSDHVLARAKSSAEYDKKSLDSVLLKMGGNITVQVFKAWDKIFKRPAGKKEIVVSIDQGPNLAWYLQLRLKEGSEVYEISERSLGFRWFFTYLLLTQYRGFRSQSPKEVLFLLDEPASNLHPSAQTQLLESFSTLPESCTVIYTTHSHHLIKPEWLDGAYVVKNEGLHYDDNDSQYTAKRTLISVSHYREFAVKHPEQTTYFQPVLDVLDYKPSKLENVPDMIMLEGKSDYYGLKYMTACLGRSRELHLLPGTGAGSLDTIIRLYVGWARNFIVLLDSDAEGVAQKARYIEKFGSLVTNRLFVLSDLDATWKDKALERLFETTDALKIQQAVYPDSLAFNKTHLSRAFQELVLIPREILLSHETIHNFTKLLSALEDRLKAASKSPLS